jgi:hypothetical protein
MNQEKAGIGSVRLVQKWNRRHSECVADFIEYLTDMPRRIRFAHHLQAVSTFPSHADLMRSRSDLDVRETLFRDEIQGFLLVRTIGSENTV